jgi:hypothetical protein
MNILMGCTAVLWVSHDGPIWKMKVTSEIFHVYQALLLGLIVPKSYKNRWIHLGGCIKGIQGSATS